jgi:phosphatase NudJ
MGFFIGCGAVVKQGDKYILIEEVRGAKAGLYNIPAGTLEIDEDFITCIKREAKEETGADITLEHFLGIYQTVIGTGSNVVFAIFSGSVAADAVFQSDEHSVIKSLTFEEIKNLEERGILRAPTVMKAIEDERAGRLFPLDLAQSWHLDSLGSITVEK